jgi:O-antigen/teichoic acid export membrane protein
LSINRVFKTLFNSINNAKRDRENIFYAVLVEFGIKIIGIISLSHYLNIKYVLSVFIIAEIVSVFVMYVKNKNLIEFKISKKTKLYILRVFYFALPLIIWAIFGWFRDMSNRWYLDYFITKNEVGLFAMINSIAIIAPTALQGLIGGYFIPIIYEKENIQKGYAKSFLKKLIPLLFIVFLFSFIITYLFKNEIILIIADKKYLEISWMLPWMFLVFSFYSIAMISTYELFSHKKTKLLLF